MSIQLLQGNKLELPQVSMTNGSNVPIVKLPIEENGVSSELRLSEDDFSKHLLIVGGIGSGKTNTFNYIISSLSESMTVNDVMVIFDTKGEYLKEFYRQGDIIIANDDSLFPPRYNIDYWNIFEEILIDQKNIKDNVNEISKTLFYEQTQNTTNVFFPNAAKDIFFAYILASARKHIANNTIMVNNRELSSFFNQVDVDMLNELFEIYPDLRSIKNYISNKGQQTQGVLSEVIRLVRDIFTGNFEKVGDLSIRNAIRKKGNKRIFIEYDLGIGNVLSPIYRLLIDLAIKESLCRDKSAGNVYFVLDEFRLLPHLQHVDDGINFGRSQGAKFIIGMQNIQQINEAYGENIAGSILSGLSTKFVFRVNDYKTREYVKNLFGKNRYVEAFYSQDTSKGLVEEIVEGNVAEDWIINKLPTGVAIYTSVGCDPRIIRMFEYGKSLPITTFNIKRERTHPDIDMSNTIPSEGFNIKQRNRNILEDEVIIAETRNDRADVGSFNIRRKINGNLVSENSPSKDDNIGK